MLIEFTVGNYRSFKQTATLNMTAAKLSSRDFLMDQTNTIAVTDQLKLLPTAAIYGANASGKSNLVKALAFVRKFILSSSKESQAEDPIGTVPFRLDIENENAPSFFEIVFLIDGILYRYGFEVSAQRVETEWLFYSPKGIEAKLFTREKDSFHISRGYKGGKIISGHTRANALFLSVSAQFNIETANIILGWVKSLKVISGLEDNAYQGFSAHMYKYDEKYRDSILELIKGSDFGINNMLVKTIGIHDPEAFPKDMPQELRDFVLKQVKEDSEIFSFKSVHKKICNNGETEEVQFDMDDESEGTKKIFYLSGPIINSLITGNVLVIDEIEARLHTKLTQRLIQLFNSEKTNPKHAQLIFATHDTNLLSNKIFRRDQIWFVEKDEAGASHLYSLAELKVRNDRSFENDYLEGRYGGVPVLGEMRQVIIDMGKEAEHDGK